MSKNIYIDTIKYGEKRLMEKSLTNPDDLKSFLISKGYNIPNSDFLNNLFLDVFGTQSMRNENSQRASYLSADAYFKLLEYEELKHARKSSAQAQENATKAIRLSKWALWISAFLAFISIIVSI